MGWKVLVTARAFWVSGQEARALLERAGCEVVHSSRPGPLSEEELIAQLEGCHAAIGSSDPYNGRVFAACPDLKIVARCGVGTDSVDMAAATAAGVVATNTPGAMKEAVADFTFALMLGIARGIAEGHALMRSGGWNEIRGSGVYGKTLGLVGIGRIGAGVAERARGFRMRVLACDPFLTGDAPEGLELVDLDTLLRESDYISLHAPATAETRGMIDAAALGKMKPTAYLINTARGALIDEPALIAALEAGSIAGAALDVYGREPLPADDPLRSAPRCLLQPHNAFNALESTMEMSRQSAVSVVDLFQGRRPENVCNPDVLASPSLRVAL